MTIDPLNSQNTRSNELYTMPVQMEVQKDMQKETTATDDFHKQLLQLLANAQPQQAIQKTAQDQISKGHIDLKI